jgi:hypothetical protein
VYFPISSTTNVVATLSILSTSLDRIYSAQQVSTVLPQLGRHVVRWDGRTEDGNIVGSGVYIYVIVLPTQTLKGKLAIIRK